MKSQKIKRNHSYESYWVLLSCVFIVLYIRGSNFWDCSWNPKVWPLKWKLCTENYTFLTGGIVQISCHSKVLLFWSLAELLRCGVEGTLMTEIKSVAHKILNENVVGILNCDRVQYNNSDKFQYIFSLLYCYFVWSTRRLSAVTHLTAGSLSELRLPGLIKESFA